MSRKLFSGLIVLLVSAGLSAPSFAEIKSFRGPLVADRLAEVSMEHSGIRITSYQFNRPLRHANAKKLFKDDGPSLKLTIVNEGEEPGNLMMGVALFDQMGNLVGVAAEESGKIKPGERKEVSLVFKHLNRYAKHASTMQLSLERHL